MTKPAERADFLFGLLWTGLGLAIAIGSWNMDRLENRGVDLYTVPGLVPGLLGIVLTIFGIVLSLRGWHGRVALSAEEAEEVMPEEPKPAAEPWRVGLALLLCLGFGLGALGHGPPFWLAAFVFLFLAILLFEYPDRRANGTVLRGAIQAAAIAAIAAFLVTLVFQEIFLVRLP